MFGQRVQAGIGATVSPADSHDFHDFLGRNLSYAYRLAAMALDDPIEAAAAVHDSTLAAWKGGAPTAAALDDLFRRQLDAALDRALPPRSGTGEASSPLEGALAGLDASRQIELARAYGFPAAADAAAADAAPDAALRELAAALGKAAGTSSGDGAGAYGSCATPSLAEMLRALYSGRDPGEPAPLALRMRLAQANRDAEARAAVAVRPTAANGWGFVFNTFLVMLVLTLVVALASVVNVRSSPVAGADPTSDPSSPLTITGVSMLQGSIDGPGVHVGSTQRTLVVSFAPAAVWHPASRDCLADVVGVVDWQGQATWLGAHAGHVESIAGDPLSPSVFAAGLGSYCESGRFSSGDGGTTWSQGSLPGDGSSQPAWSAFDPSHPGMLLAYDGRNIYGSTNAGAVWSARTTPVTPLAFDSSGRLVGWTPGKLFQSTDDGATWQQTGAGPSDRPAAAGATSKGVLIGVGSGLWWYPLDAAPSLIKAGSVYSIATLGDDAVVLGADSAGRAWLGTVGSTVPGISIAALPPEVASLHISGGEVAVNDSGAAIAFSGPTSALALATFAH